MDEWQQPIKLYQTATDESTSRLHIEIIGDDTALVDALTVIAFWQVLQDMGVSKKAVVRVNSLGNSESQTMIRRSLTEYYQSLRSHLCTRCQEAFGKNPILLLNCLSENCQPYRSTAPQPIEHLTDESRTHLMLLLEYLDGADVPYDLAPHLVLEDPYATETVVTIETKTKTPVILAYGGRYDQVISQIDGPHTPAFGATINLEQLARVVGSKPTLTTAHTSPQILIIQLGRRARKKAIPLLINLGNQGLAVTMALGRESLRGQLKSAATMNVDVALIIGEREALDDSVIIRTMQDNTQETYPIDEVERIIEQKLAELADE